MNATVTFGLVAFPVGITPATTKRETVKFRLLHLECGLPINQAKVCSTCGISLEADEIIHGYEYEKNIFVHVAEDEISEAKSLRQPVIEVSKFVPWEAVSVLPVYDSHLLVPKPGYTEHYATLRAAMDSEGVNGFGVQNLWGRTRPFMVTIIDDRLVMQRLYARDELVEPEFDAPQDVSKEGLDVATQIVRGKLGSIEEEVDLVRPDEVALRALVNAKVKGTTPKLGKRQAPLVPSADLLRDLRRSVRAGKRVTV